MGSTHLVIDGSNIATEGRSLPSLAQLLDAVDAAKQDLGAETVTVVVDATFGHRIEKAEQDLFEDKISNGEIITPPAGVIGRGDAFILEVADRVDAVVLSNDSFQEFHGDYRWLFDEGRLLGGKHVPGVGWIFLARSPVRGPASRKAISEARKKNRAQPGTAKKKPTKKSAQKSGRRSRGATKKADGAKTAKTTKAAKASKASTKAAKAAKPAKKASATEPEPYNEPLPFIEFVSAHPVGSTVEGEVEQFASHGAYVMVGDTRCYVPMKAMGDPAPRSARDILTQGEVRAFVVDAIDTPRRGIDLSLVPPDAKTAQRSKPKPKEDRQRPAEPETRPELPEEHLVTDAEVDDENLSVSQRRRLRAQLQAQEAKAAAGPDTDEVEDETPAKTDKAAQKSSTARKSPAKRAGRAAPAKKAPAKKSARASSTKKSSTKTSTGKKSASTKKAAQARSTKKSPAQKSTSKKAASTKKTPAKKTPRATSTKKSTRASSSKKSTSTRRSKAPAKKKKSTADE